MAGTLCIAVCDNFRDELNAAIHAEGWDDVQPLSFRAGCGRPPLAREELQQLQPVPCGQTVIFGSVCLGCPGTPPAAAPDIRYERLEQCFHLIAGSTLVDSLIAGGSYLVTPGWAAEWQNDAAGTGIDPAGAAAMISESSRDLVCLDTGIHADTAGQLAGLAAVTGLPERRIAVGLDHVRLLLTRVVLSWRMEQERRAAAERNRRNAGELAEHAAAMDMLKHLAGNLDENEVISAIEELFTMLFAPAAFHYCRVEREQPIPVREVPVEILSALHDLTADYDWTPDGQGFLLRISYGGTLLGLAAVDRLTFPAYRERYLNMALAITGVCGLAIENARNRRRLIEAEKMASLTFMVAGVAHEINTPLGVVQAAASTIRDKSRQIARVFSEKSMTRSDLAGFMETVETGSNLICQHMERIGHLTDTFRQVAVTDGERPRTAVRLADCLDAVIRSMGEHLPSDRISLMISCPPDLEMRCQADEWAAVFINLIGNSVKHGFRERERGTIRIDINGSPTLLRIDYRDDGAGMPPEVRARIFDPFFTTDLRNGMGLGMHLVYNLVTHRFGGQITCDSLPGQGVLFHIEVPL